MDRKEREKIEQQGVPYIINSLLDCIEDITLEDIELVTNKQQQYKGIDYIVCNKLYIDSKFHINKNNNKILTYIPIEITKSNGCKGWGIDTTLATNYILDFTMYHGYYVLDCQQLHKFMLSNYNKYASIYNQNGEEGHKHTKAVSIKDLEKANVIVYKNNWNNTTEEEAQALQKS